MAGEIMQGGTVTHPGREVGGLAPCQCFVSRDTQELAAVQGAGELCLVTDDVLIYATILDGRW